MLNVIRYNKLGQAERGWLHARHHFNFGDYFDPRRTGFGCLIVINDDIVEPQKGFDPHPHEDMEIITYVRQGAITHEDNQGNRGVTKAGDVQVMSAGTGIVHSEYNLEAIPTSLYQIWIVPDQKGVKPRWEAKAFPKEPVQNQLTLLVSGQEGEGLFMYQDARVLGGRLHAQSIITEQLKHQGYLLVSEGKVSLDGQTLEKGDGAEITDQDQITLEALTDAEVLLIDVPA